MNKNILLLSAGRRVELLRIFKDNFKESNFIYTVDSNPLLSPCCLLNNKYIKIPKCNDKNYINKLLKISKKLKIKLIIPTIDNELLKLAKNKSLFMQIGTNVLVSKTEFIQKTENKIMTKEIFDEIGIAYPEILSKKKLKFPCISKPIKGSGSKNITYYNSKDDLIKKNYNNSKLFFQRYILGYEEYTIDAYYNRDSKLISLCARKRIDVRSGEVIKSKTNLKVSKLLWPYLSKIKSAIGPITFQIFYNNAKKNIYGIEINARLGGGCTLSYHAGINFAKNIYDEYLKEKNISKYNKFPKDNVLLLRYEKDHIVK